MIKLAIFASGSGSNAENIASYFKNNPCIEIVCVISNKKDAFVHQRAKQFKIPSYTFSKKEFDEGIPILDFLRNFHVDFIVLAGFLLKVAPNVIDNYPNRIINIHPALLPKYGGKRMYGMHVHRTVHAAKEQETGITIHYVNEQYDEGNIIFQARCTLSEDDTPERIAEKVHALEYAHFPRVIETTVENAFQEHFNKK